MTFTLLKKFAKRDTCNEYFSYLEYDKLFLLELIQDGARYYTRLNTIGNEIHLHKRS